MPLSSIEASFFAHLPLPKTPAHRAHATPVDAVELAAALRALTAPGCGTNFAPPAFLAALFISSLGDYVTAADATVGQRELRGRCALVAVAAAVLCAATLAALAALAQPQSSTSRARGRVCATRPRYSYAGLALSAGLVGYASALTRATANLALGTVVGVGGAHVAGLALVRSVVRAQLRTTRAGRGWPCNAYEGVTLATTLLHAGSAAPSCGTAAKRFAERPRAQLFFIDGALRFQPALAA